MSDAVDVKSHSVDVKSQVSRKSRIAVDVMFGRVKVLLPIINANRVGERMSSRSVQSLAPTEANRV